MLALPAYVSVTSAEVVRHFGRWQDHAASEPVVVTHHGRARLVMLSAAHYEQMAATQEDGRATPDPATGDDAAIEQLMEHVAQGFVAFDAEFRVRAINRAACCFMKATREAVIGRRLDERLPGVQETLGYASLTRAARSGSICTLEMPSFAFEGRWLLCQTFPYRDGAACLFRDITEEVEAREQTDARAALLSALAAHGGIGRAKLTTRGTFGEADATLAGFTGLPASSLAQMRPADLVHEAHRPAMTHAVEAALEGETPAAFEVALLGTAGTEVPVRIGLAPLRSQRAISGAVLVASALA